MPPLAINIDIKKHIKEKAYDHGFSTVGVTKVDSAPEQIARLYDFLKEGRHGEMDWMERSAERRGNPRRLWPEARSAILLTLNYTPEEDPLLILKKKEKGAISVFAQSDDYHLILKKKAQDLIHDLKIFFQGDFKIYVDTAPLMEKPLAASAGLGWQGKHTNLVSRTYGSWLFLCVILTDIIVDPDPPSQDHCGSCQKCLTVCPTDAFPAPYQLDARRCISYLTIEHKSQIAREFRDLIGNRIFGCDDCLAVCPWNKFAKKGQKTQFEIRLDCKNPPLKQLLNLKDDTFRKRFEGTTIKRTGRDRFVRNVLIAAGNSKDSSLIPDVVSLLIDTSWLVRGMAVWAASKLLGQKDFNEERKKHLPRETIQSVREEWLMGGA